MNYFQKSFIEISEECWNWSIKTEEQQKEIKCNLNGFDVKIVLTRMIWDDSRFAVITPNRINVSSDNQEIQRIFMEHLWQPEIVKKTNERVWVFKNDPNVLLQRVQYELRFFESEEKLNDQLSKDVREKMGGCIIV